MSEVVIELSPMEAELVKRWRLRRFRFRFLRMMALLVVLGLAYFAVTPLVELGWNVTESLPGRLFLIVKHVKPGKGEMVAFYPPKNPYYPPHMYFTKIVKGETGDVVSHRGRDIYINGEKIGSALDFDTSHRRKLDMSAEGVIPMGFRFVWTPHPHSYDSRYADIGLVSDSQVIGRAYRLL